MTLVCNVEDITSTYDRFTKIPCNYSIKTKTHTLNIVCFPLYMTCNKLTKHSASVLKNASDPSATGGRTAWLRSARENLAAPRVSSGKIQKMLNVLSKHRYLESMVIDQWSIKYDFNQQEWCNIVILPRKCGCFTNRNEVLPNRHGDSTIKNSVLAPNIWGPKHQTKLLGSISGGKSRSIIQSP